MTANALIMSQRISISSKCCSFELSIHQKTVGKKIMIMIFTQIRSSITGFNTDNNQKCFLSSKSDLKDHVTLKTGVMMLKFTGINYI